MEESNLALKCLLLLIYIFYIHVSDTLHNEQTYGIDQFLPKIHEILHKSPFLILHV